MGVVIREMHLSVETSLRESGFYFVIMFTVNFLLSLCVFELTAFHQTRYRHRITIEFITESAIIAKARTVLIVDICEAVYSLPSRVKCPKYQVTLDL